MNPITTIMMLIMASILNFGILKFLTVKLAPINVVQGKIGNPGPIGFRGKRGKLGDQGIAADRRLLGTNDILIGDKGIRGVKGIDASCDRQIGKYCIQEDSSLGLMGKGSHMNLTGYRARSLPDLCLFGYEPEPDSAGNIICKSPITGNRQHKDCPVGRDGNCITHKTRRWNSNIIDESSVYYFRPDEWAPVDAAGTLMNCSYKKDVIEKMSPAQFSSWTRLLAKRDCPGVPVNGTTKIPPEKDSQGRMIWPEPRTCKQEITPDINIGYYNEYSIRGGWKCVKSIIPKNSSRKRQLCDCKPYPKKELGEECVVNNECNGRYNICINNRCVENCSRYGADKELGTENTDSNDNLSQYKCYKVLGSQCSSNTDCSSGECVNSKCVEMCQNNKMTPHEFNGIYDEEVYVDQPFDINSYGSEIRGTAYKCFNNPTPAPTPAPSKCPMHYPDTTYNRKAKRFNSCPTGRLNLPDSKITVASSEETSIVAKNINVNDADDVYIGAEVGTTA